MCIYFYNGDYIPAVEVDINTMATKPIEDLSDGYIKFPQYMLTRNEYIMYVSRTDDIMVLKNGKVQFNVQVPDQFELDNNDDIIWGRFHQQFGADVYVVDANKNLYSICWTDIENDIFVVPKLIDMEV